MKKLLLVAIFVFSATAVYPSTWFLEHINNEDSNNYTEEREVYRDSYNQRNFSTDQRGYRTPYNQRNFGTDREKHVFPYNQTSF